jgi:RecB family exonuclease
LAAVCFDSHSISESRTARSAIDQLAMRPEIGEQPEKAEEGALFHCSFSRSASARSLATQLRSSRIAPTRGSTILDIKHVGHNEADRQPL